MFTNLYPETELFYLTINSVHVITSFPIPTTLATCFDPSLKQSLLKQKVHSVSIPQAHWSLCFTRKNIIYTVESEQTLLQLHLKLDEASL